MYSSFQKEARDKQMAEQKLQCGMCGSTGIADQSHSDSIVTEYDFCECQIGQALDRQFASDIEEAIDFHMSKVDDSIYIADPQDLKFEHELDRMGAVA